MKLLTMTGDPAAVVAALRDFAPPADEVRSTVKAIVAEVRAHGDDAVRAYSKRLDKVDLPLDYPGSAFQQRVWEELLRIPYGETRSYAQLAEAISRPGAARAVGHANGQNRIAILIPCHRVIAADGGLGGYGGGLWRKLRLLETEGRPPR